MPADSELVHRFRPRGVRIVGGALFAILAVSVVATWFLLPDTAQARFHALDLVLTLFVTALFVVAGTALLRCRLDATEAGLLVVNGYRTHDLAWNQVVRLTMPQGAPFARLDLTDGSTISLVALQSSDGDRARRDLRLLRSLVAERQDPTPDN